MIRACVSLVLSLLTALVVDILNPLFVIALALFVSVGYLLTLLIPVTISHWQLIFWLSLFLALAGLLLRARRLWRAGAYHSTGFSWRFLLSFLPLLIFVPIFQLELSTPYLQIIYHGDIHVGYVHQLLYGATPLDNIFVPGYSPNYYWLYHALLASIVQLTSLAPPLVASVINMAAILSSLLWMALTLIRLRIAASRTILLCLLTILVYCSVNLTGPLTVSESLLGGTEAPIYARQMVLAGGDQRLHSVMGKVMNFTSFPLAMLAFVVALYVCVRLTKGECSRFLAALATASVLASLAFQPIAALYQVVMLFGGMTLATTLCWLGKANRITQLKSFCRERLSELGAVFLVVWLASSLTFALLLLRYASDLSAGSGLNVTLNWLSSPNIWMIFAAVILLVPLFLLHTAVTASGRRREDLFIQISSILGILLTASLLLPDANQYKGVYFLAILMALAGLKALQAPQDSSARHWRIFARAAAGALLALAMIKVVIVTRHYENFAYNRVYEYDRRHISYRAWTNPDGLAEALYWLRTQTAADAVVILPLDVVKYTHMIHERQTYVRKTQNRFTDHIPAYNIRVEHLERLYSDLAVSDDDEFLLEDMASELPGRPLYAVIHDDEASADTMAARGATKVFDSPDGGADVYLLNPSSEA